ncbi:hypothetical protein CH380_12495 [Leptospira adleri]|uniref:Uncharacterized protein n=1 Tax=Leptospira adleri TaxID=2023186 RepID=A0A2M9YMV5_9LEPT|nr:hypothetical protein CH380_12495 [Leptospira adleri]PJZ62508.1 hypothetical protein CH376_07660 [Leptospira adleri]
MGGGKLRETFLYQKIILYASKKRSIGTPTKIFLGILGTNNFPICWRGETKYGRSKKPFL